MSELRACVIGLGIMGANHARVLQNLEGVTMVAAVDPAGDPLQRVLFAPVLTDLEEALALRPDFCIVATPTRLHEEIGLRLAEAGIHALIEKPLAHTVDAACRIAAAFEKAGLIGGVGHIERFNPAIRSLRDRIGAGDLGEVFQITTRRVGPYPDRIQDVGVVKDLATHDIDLTRWIADSPYMSIAAHTASKTGSPYEDLLVASGRLANGIITNHLVNWLTPSKERRTTATGEKGCFVADTLTGDLTFYANGHIDVEWNQLRAFRGVTEGDITRFAIPRPEPLLVELSEFRDAILSGDTSRIVTLDAGREVVEVTGAIIESAASGRTASTKWSTAEPNHALHP